MPKCVVRFISMLITLTFVSQNMVWAEGRPSSCLMFASNVNGISQRLDEAVKKEQVFSSKDVNSALSAAFKEVSPERQKRDDVEDQKSGLEILQRLQMFFSPERAGQILELRNGETPEVPLTDYVKEEKFSTNMGQRDQVQDELVSNAIDAVVRSVYGVKAAVLGRHGIAVLQVFGELIGKEEMIVLESRKRGDEKISTFIFYMNEDGKIVVKSKRDPAEDYSGVFPAGTSFTIVKHQNKKTRAGRRERIGKNFQACRSAEIMISEKEFSDDEKEWKRVNDLPNYANIGGEEFTLDGNVQGSVSVMINSEGYQVRDTGIGMSYEEIEKYVLLPHSRMTGGDTEAEKGLLLEAEPVIRSEMYSSDIANSGRIYLTVAGRCVGEPVEVKSAQIPKETYFDFPAGVKVPPEWDRIILDPNAPVVISVLRKLAEEITDTSKDVRERYAKLQALAVLTDSLSAKENGMVVLEQFIGLKNFIRDRIKALLFFERGKVPAGGKQLLVLPNLPGFEDINYKKGPVIYLPPEYYDFSSEDLSQLEKANQQDFGDLAVNKKLVVFLADFSESSDTFYLKGGGKELPFVVVDKKTWTCEDNSGFVKAILEKEFPPAFESEAKSKGPENPVGIDKDQKGVSFLSALAICLGGIVCWMFLAAVLFIGASNYFGTKTMQGIQRDGFDFPVAANGTATMFDRITEYFDGLHFGKPMLVVEDSVEGKGINTKLVGGFYYITSDGSFQQDDEIRIVPSGKKYGEMEVTMNIDVNSGHIVRILIPEDGVLDGGSLEISDAVRGETIDGFEVQNNQYLVVPKTVEGRVSVSYHADRYSGRSIGNGKKMQLSPEEKEDALSFYGPMLLKQLSSMGYTLSEIGEASTRVSDSDKIKAIENVERELFYSDPDAVYAWNGRSHTSLVKKVTKNGTVKMPERCGGTTTAFAIMADLMDLFVVIPYAEVVTNGELWRSRSNDHVYIIARVNGAWVPIETTALIQSENVDAEEPAFSFYDFAMAVLAAILSASLSAKIRVRKKAEQEKMNIKSEDVTALCISSGSNEDLAITTSQGGSREDILLNGTLLGEASLSLGNVYYQNGKPFILGWNMSGGVTIWDIEGKERCEFSINKPVIIQAKNCFLLMDRDKNVYGFENGKMVKLCEDAQIFFDDHNVAYIYDTRKKTLCKYENGKGSQPQEVNLSDYPQADSLKFFSPGVIGIESRYHGLLGLVEIAGENRWVRKEVQSFGAEVADLLDAATSPDDVVSVQHNMEFGGTRIGVFEAKSTYSQSYPFQSVSTVISKRVFIRRDDRIIKKFAGDVAVKMIGDKLFVWDTIQMIIIFNDGTIFYKDNPIGPPIECGGKVFIAFDRYSTRIYSVGEGVPSDDKNFRDNVLTPVEGAGIKLRGNAQLGTVKKICSVNGSLYVFGQAIMPDGRRRDVILKDFEEYALARKVPEKNKKNKKRSEEFGKLLQVLFSHREDWYPRIYAYQYRYFEDWSPVHLLMAYIVDKDDISPETLKAMEGWLKETQDKWNEKNVSSLEDIMLVCALISKNVGDKDGRELIKRLLEWQKENPKFIEKYVKGLLNIETVNGVPVRVLKGLKDEKIFNGLSQSSKMHIGMLKGDGEYFLQDGQDETEFKTDHFVSEMPFDAERGLEEVILAGKRAGGIDGIEALKKAHAESLKYLFGETIPPREQWKEKLDEIEKGGDPEKAKAAKEFLKYKIGISGAITAQSADEMIFLRELIQNSRDEMRAWEGMGRSLNGAKKIGVRSYLNKDRWILSVTDPCGMDVERIVKKVLTPGETTRGSDLSIKDAETLFAGRFGWGFFTVFEDCSEVCIRTFYGGKGYEFRLRPRYSAVGKEGNKTLLGISVIEAKEYNSSEAFRGTEIQRIKYLKDYVDPNDLDGSKDTNVRRYSLPEVMFEHARAKAMLTRYVGAVSDVEISWKIGGSSILVNEKKEKKPLFEVKRSGHKGHIRLYPSTQESRVTVGGLYVQAVDEDLLSGIPYPWLKKQVLDKKLNFEFDKGTPILATRRGLKKEPGQYSGKIKELVFKWAVEAYRNGEIEIPGLSRYEVFIRNVFTPVPAELYPLLSIEVIDRASRQEMSLLDERKKISLEKTPKWIVDRIGRQDVALAVARYADRKKLNSKENASIDIARQYIKAIVIGILRGEVEPDGIDEKKFDVSVEDNYILIDILKDVVGIGTRFYSNSDSIIYQSYGNRMDTYKFEEFLSYVLTRKREEKILSDISNELGENIITSENDCLMACRDMMIELYKIILGGDEDRAFEMNWDMRKNQEIVDLMQVFLDGGKFLEPLAFKMVNKLYKNNEDAKQKAITRLVVEGKRRGGLEKDIRGKIFAKYGMERLVNEFDALKRRVSSDISNRSVFWRVLLSKEDRYNLISDDSTVNAEGLRRFLTDSLSPELNRSQWQEFEERTREWCVARTREVFEWKTRKDGVSSERLTEVFTGFKVREEGIACGDAMESAHRVLNDILTRQFAVLRKMSGKKESEAPVLTEEESDNALVLYMEKRFGVTIAAEQLKGYREEIRRSPGAWRGVKIFFAVPELGRELFWIKDDEKKKWVCAGGHYSKKERRMHISLPIILKRGIEEGKKIALHELKHLNEGVHYSDDEGAQLVAKINEEEKQKWRDSIAALRRENIHYGLDKGGGKELCPEKRPFCDKLKAALVTVNKEYGYHFDYETIEKIANSVVKMKAGSIETMYLFGVINVEQRNVLLDVSNKIDSSESFTDMRQLALALLDVVSSYSGLSKRQKEDMIKRLIPASVFGFLAGEYNVPLAKVPSIIGSHPGFIVWLPDAERMVDKILNRPGRAVKGLGVAWNIVKRGIEKAEKEVESMIPEVERLIAEEGLTEQQAWEKADSGGLHSTVAHTRRNGDGAKKISAQENPGTIGRLPRSMLTAV